METNTLIAVCVVCATIVILVSILKRTKAQIIEKMTEFFKAFNPLTGIWKKN